MSEKWTKGPWFVRDLSPTRDGHPYFIVQSGGPDIGDGWVDGEYFSLSGIMTRETASLISAAPDRRVSPVLVGCEESQTICKAFREAGYEAYSCDIEPTRGTRTGTTSGTLWR